MRFSSALRHFNGVVSRGKGRQQRIDHDPPKRAGRILALADLRGHRQFLAIAIQHPRGRRRRDRRRQFQSQPVAARESRIGGPQIPGTGRRPTTPHHGFAERQALAQNHACRTGQLDLLVGQRADAHANRVLPRRDAAGLGHLDAKRTVIGFQIHRA